MINRAIVIGLAGLLGLTTAVSQNPEIQKLDEVVVTDSRFEIKRENSGKTVIKISKKELEERQGESLAQIINTKSGITINGANSAAGQTLGTYVRGGQNRQVLVLIDGVAINDASNIENNFDLNLIALDQIESIEILKGASSVLYGNRASTAVINITLKKPEEGTLNASFSSFIGTNNDQRNSNIDIADFTNAVNVNGHVKKLSYRVSFSNTYTDGLSAVQTNNDTSANESDPFSRYNTQLNLGYEFSKSFSLSATGSFDKYRTEYDDSFGFMDANNTSNNELKRLTISPKYTYNKGEIQINGGFNETSREYDSSFPSKYNARSFVIDAFNKFRFNDSFFVILGVNYIDSEMQSFTIPFGSSEYTEDISPDEASDAIFDPYFNTTYISNFGLNINAGLRLNNHSEYGSHFVYNLNPSYVFKINNNAIKVLSSVSTAYITPSLFQLFAPSFGNADLKPQEDRTIEAGLNVNFSKKIDITVLYFNRNQNQFIDYVITDFATFAGEYQNTTDEFAVEGVELEVQYLPTSRISVNANYTFTERREGALFRIPKHKVNAMITAQLKTNTSVGLSYQYNSNRVSPFLNEEFTEHILLDSFSLLDLNANQVVIKDRLKVFASIHNLFNTDYEELYRYSTRGRNFKFGFTLTF